MIHSYVKFSEFVGDVAKQKVFCRIRFFQPSPQEAPMLPDVKVIGEMRFTCMTGSAIKAFLRQAIFKSDDPTSGEKEKFSIEFKTLCRVLSAAKCALYVGEVGDVMLGGEIDDPSVIQSINEIYAKLTEAKNQPQKVEEKEQPVPEVPQDSTGISESVGAALG